MTLINYNIIYNAEFAIFSLTSQKHKLNPGCHYISSDLEHSLRHQVIHQVQPAIWHSTRNVAIRTFPFFPHSHMASATFSGMSAVTCSQMGNKLFRSKIYIFLEISFVLVKFPSSQCCPNETDGISVKR